jgi:hypothetical protein
MWLRAALLERCRLSQPNAVPRWSLHSTRRVEAVPSALPDPTATHFSQPPPPPSSVAQVADDALLSAAKKTCALTLYPQTPGVSPFSCIGDDSDNIVTDSPFGSSYVISIGYLVVAAVTVPLSLFNLDDNIIFQMLGMLLLTVAVVIWCAQFAVLGLSASNMTAFAPPGGQSAYGSVIAAVLFNYGEWAGEGGGARRAHWSELQLTGIGTACAAVIGAGARQAHTRDRNTRNATPRALNSATAAGSPFSCDPHAPSPCSAPCGTARHVAGCRCARCHTASRMSFSAGEAGRGVEGGGGDSEHVTCRVAGVARASHTPCAFTPAVSPDRARPHHSPPPSPSPSPLPPPPPHPPPACDQGLWPACRRGPTRRAPGCPPRAPSPGPSPSPRCCTWRWATLAPCRCSTAAGWTSCP